MASSSSARSSTLRAIGPWTPRVRSILAAGLRATRPMLGNRQPHQPVRVRPRPVEAEGRQGVDASVDRGDPGFQRVEQVMRGYFAPLQQADERYRVGFDQFAVAWHRLSPLLYCEPPAST